MPIGIPSEIYAAIVKMSPEYQAGYEAGVRDTKLAALKALVKLEEKIRNIEAFSTSTNTTSL